MNANNLEINAFAFKGDATPLIRQLFNLPSANHAQETINSAKNLHTPKPAINNQKLANADQAQNLLSQGLAFHQQGQLTEALACYQQVLTFQPENFDALHLLGVISAQEKQPEKAITYINKAIAINPNQADAYYNLGCALQELEQIEAALENYNKAIALKPDYPVAHYNCGVLLQSLGKYQEAVDSYDKAIAFKPDYAKAYSNRGSVSQRLNRYQDALDSYGQAINIKPDYAEAYNNRGSILSIQFNKYQEAIDNYDKALAINPGFAEAHCHRGIALQSLRQFEDATQSFERAIALNPDYVDAYYNLANTQLLLWEHQAALKSYEKVIALMPEHPYVHGKLLYTKMYVCDWTDIEEQYLQLALMIEQGKRASDPMPVLAMLNSLSSQQKAAQSFAKDRYPITHALSKIGKRNRHDKIRIGYFSADFRYHAVSFLMAELFETHDKTKFELTAFSYRPDTTNLMAPRLEAAFDNFIDVQFKSDQEVAQLARDMEIDIAIDLVGYTNNCRAGVFALRAAPIQVSYIGYLGTMGAEFMDYLIADPVLIPKAAKPFYSEKIVYLPSYQANDSKRLIAEKEFSRQELGLPEQGFVFCCFNANFKITPSVYDSWMRILSRVPDSVLLILTNNDLAEINLRKEAECRGVDSKRIVLGKHLPRPEYLARYRSTDLFLDTLPYNAGTTASDALWAGLPVLTCMGETFASRVAASLLTAIHLPELITTSQADYETLAIDLATNPDKLNAIKDKLQRNRLTTLLFNTLRFTRNLETAFNTIYERYQADLPPEDIYCKGRKSH